MKPRKDNNKPDKRRRETPPESPWERHSGEGSATALDNLKRLERTRKKLVPKSDDTPSAG